MTARYERLQVVLTPAEMRYVERYAKREHRSRSGWGRDVILEALNKAVREEKVTNGGGSTAVRTNSDPRD